MKAIILDLGNVLVDFDHRIAARRIAPYTEKIPQEVYDLFFNSDVTGLFERGEISPEDFFGRVKKVLRANISYQEFLPIWNGIFFLTPKNLAVYHLAQALRKNYCLALLTNINVLHFAYLKEKFPVFDVFDHIIASCDLHRAKPDPLIYRAALDLVGCEAGDVFYADDRPELVAGARRLGINAFVFTDALQLEKDLAGCGVTQVAHAI
jgi:putative hydrolase of the HAD superfamily